MQTSSPMDVRTTTSTNVSCCPKLPIIVVLTGVLLLLFKHALDLVAQFATRVLDVVFGVPIRAHEAEEAVIGEINLSSAH